jgi:hypothetical protein
LDKEGNRAPSKSSLLCSEIPQCFEKNFKCFHTKSYPNLIKFYVVQFVVGKQFKSLRFYLRDGLGTAVKLQAIPSA